MAQLCEKCNNKMMLVAGTFYFEPDPEPYEAGEEIEVYLTGDKHICAMYCEKCDKLQKIWED